MILVPFQDRSAIAPDLAGAVLPVSRTRCINLIAADGLTSKRRAAPRAEPPASIVFAIRSRKSCDRGAFIEASHINKTYESNSTIPRKQELF